MKPVETHSKLGAFPLILSRIAPFLLPALFFQSAIFAFISPLPLFILTLRNHIRMSVLAMVTNAAILYSLGTRTELTVGVTLWFMVGVLFPFLIRKTGKIQLSFGLSFLIFISLILGSLLTYTSRLNVNPVDFVRSEISEGITQLAAIPDSPVKKILEEQGQEGVFKQIVTELPSGLLITLVLAFWVNLLFASQLMSGFLSKSFWASYRNPEWMIWPTIACAGLFAFADHAPYFIGLNGFKLLLVFYGFQGLSILSHLLNRYKILGLGRAIIFSLAIFVMMPVVISLGFFDLWFDFRRKFGQT
jgi:hypothetical protein